MVEWKGVIVGAGWMTGRVEGRVEKEGWEMGGAEN